MADTLVRMKYHVGEKVGFKVQAPIQEVNRGSRRRGEYGPQHCGIGTVKSLVESKNSYTLSMAGMEYTASEEEILGKVSWNAESGKWQIDPI